MVSNPRIERPRLLCLMQLPPPVHGMTTISERVANSELLASRFDLETLPLAFASSFQDLERPSLRKLGRTLETAVRLARTLAARRPAAVYFTLAPTGAAFYRDCLFVAIMKVFRVPRIYHLHGKGIRSRLASRPQRHLYQWAFRDAWVIHLAERLVADIEGLVPRDRVLIVPNGIVERDVPARRSAGAPARLLFLSNLIESKGPLVLLQALELLQARGVRFEATFAGAVHDDRFLARFRAEVGSRDLERHVRYVGPAYDEDKHRLFDEHDVFVFPTLKDAFPLVALEAMQAGLPVVTTAEGALPDIVEDGETGLVVPPHDPVALADRLAALLADTGLQQRMGSRGKERHAQRYTLAAFEHNLSAALAACVRAAGGGAS